MACPLFGVSAIERFHSTPLLFSSNEKEAMKKPKTQMDFHKVTIFGRKVKIYFTSTGHFCVKLENKFMCNNTTSFLFTISFYNLFLLIFFRKLR